MLHLHNTLRLFFSGIISVLLLLPSVSAAPITANKPAASTQNRIGIGFEYGINYLMPAESRYKGSGQFFALLFPLGGDTIVSVYHERDRLSGEDTAAAGGAKINSTLDIDINELRISKGFFSLVYPVIGFGSSSISNGFSENSIIADIGISIIPSLDSGNSLGTARFAVSVLYRFQPINARDAFVGAPNPKVDDLGGLVIGVSLMVLF